MKKTLLMVLPFFLIARAGYLAARLRYLSNNLFDALSQFVFAIALPVCLFRALARTGLPDRSPSNLVEFLAIYFRAPPGRW